EKGKMQTPMHNNVCASASEIEPLELPHGVDNDSAVYAVNVAGILAEELRRVVLGLRDGEAIVAAQPPTIVRRVPFHPAAKVAGKKCFVARDTEAGALEHRQAAESRGAVRDERSMC